MEIDFYCIDFIDQIGHNVPQKISAPALLQNLRRYEEASFCYECFKSVASTNFKSIFGRIFGDFNSEDLKLNFGYRIIEIKTISDNLNSINIKALLNELNANYNQPIGYDLIEIKDFSDFKEYLIEWLEYINIVIKNKGCLNIVLDW